MSVETAAFAENNDFLLEWLEKMDADDGGPARPRSELERSAVKAALRASLDFYVAVHGHGKATEIVSRAIRCPVFVNDEISGGDVDGDVDDGGKMTTKSSDTVAVTKARTTKRPNYAAAAMTTAAPKGPLWSDITSDDDVK